MPRSVNRSLAVALGILIGFVSMADAQTAHRRQRNPAAEGHQIVVHARESYLTAGTAAPVGSYSGYAFDTIASTAPYMPFIDHTTLGLHGQNRIPTNFTVPNCCAP
jgi:hypothetical protein